MKRFQFPLEAALKLRRRRVESAEAALAQIEGRRTAALRQAAAFEAQSAAVRESVGAVLILRGVDLRRAEAASQGLLVQAQSARQATRSMDGDLDRARAALLHARREAEALERLREQTLREWRLAAGREEEALAAELFLARFAKRDNQDR